MVKIVIIAYIPLTTSTVSLQCSASDGRGRQFSVLRGEYGRHFAYPTLILHVQGSPGALEVRGDAAEELVVKREDYAFPTPSDPTTAPVQTQGPWGYAGGLEWYLDTLRRYSPGGMVPWWTMQEVQCVLWLLQLAKQLLGAFYKSEQFINCAAHFIIHSPSPSQGHSYLTLALALAVALNHVKVYGFIKCAQHHYLRTPSSL